MNHNTNIRIGSLKPSLTNLKQFEKKDGLLSYTFDHIYACNEGNTKNNAENTRTNSDQSEVNNAIDNKDRSTAFSQLNDNFNNTISEVRHLKDLLLLHLDLIQQQSEQLLTKDKLISSLKQENDLLKSRLNRSDRRVYSKRGNINGNTHNQSPEHRQIQSPSIEAFLSNGYHNSIQDSANSIENSASVYNEPSLNNLPLKNVNNQNCNDKVKSKFSKQKVLKTNGIRNSLESSIIGENGGSLINKIILPKINTNYELTLNNGLNGVSNTNHHNNGTGHTTPYENEILSSDEVKPEFKQFCEDDGISSDPTNSQDERKRTNQNMTSDCLVSDRPHNHDTKKRARELLMTSKEYHISIGDVEFGSEEQDVSIKDESSILEVPRWCGQTYTSSTSVEGIENLDDSVIAKRHMKMEIEEKRRKRWDVQRIREQRTIERLKSRQSRSGASRISVGGAMAGSNNGVLGGPASGGRLSPGDGEDDFEAIGPRSLWPHPQDARYIMLTEQLPVCALGANLPILQPREFSLPWSTRPSVRSPGGTVTRRSSQTISRRRRQKRQRVKSRTKSLA